MKLVVGLGNPGKEYAKTRHNVGFMVVDRISTKSEIRNSKQIQNSKFKFSKKFNAEILQAGDILLVKPRTFMNRSGEAVKKIMTNYKLPMPNLYIVHDDLDIPLGKYKIQKGKGPKEHRGIVSIEQALASKNFWRVRIGVDNRHVARGMWHVGSGDEYVLSKFPGEERKVIEGVIQEVVKDLWAVLSR